MTKTRSLRWRGCLVGLVLLLALSCAQTSALANTGGTAGASLSVSPGNQVNWKGYAVGMYTTWTYSWHLELYVESTGEILDSMDRRNFGGSTYVDTPSNSNYVDPRVHPGYYCTRFALHHGTTNAGPLVDEAIACNDPRQIAPAGPATSPDGLAPDAGMPAKTTGYHQR